MDRCTHSACRDSASGLRAPGNHPAQTRRTRWRESHTIPSRTGGSKLRQAQQKIGKVVPRTWNRRSARVLSGRKTREGEAALRVSRRPEALQNSPVIAADPQVVLAPAPGNEVAQRVSLVETPLRSWIVQPGEILEAEPRNSPVKRILRDPADSRLAGDVCQKGVQVGRGRMQVVVIESHVVRESSSRV